MQKIDVKYLENSLTAFCSIFFKPCINVTHFFGGMRSKKNKIESNTFLRVNIGETTRNDTGLFMF